MSEINRTSQEIQNPVIQQTLIADKMLDEAEKKQAERNAERHHDKLHHEEVIDGGGRTKEAQLAQIVAGKKSV